MATETDERKYVTVDQFLAQNRGVVGRTALYEALRRDEIPHARIGRKILVPADALDRLVARRTNTAGELERTA